MMLARFRFLRAVLKGWGVDEAVEGDGRVS